jgi:BASS family bile acid:Na+ symporter
VPELDAVRIQFGPQSLLLLNLSLSLIMFGVALNLTVGDFRRLVAHPKAALVGITAQFVVLPVLTFGLVWLLRPQPSIALGMILVAACPGGNISNFMSMNADGNTALSVTLTAVSTVGAVALTPLNLAFWGGLYPPAASLLTTVDVSFWHVFKTVALILGGPLMLGMAVRHWAPDGADRLHRGMQALSLALFASIVAGALWANYEYLVGYLGTVFDLVLLHNACALTAGYWLARGMRLSVHSRRTLALETGIQNSGLGLILIFNFFDGLGGMAVVAAWWGVWHIVSGLGLSFYWRSRPFPLVSVENP